MKRILPILLVILLIGNMCFTATAVGGSQQTESRTSFVVVYCQAPESWEECYVYWWGSTEGSAQWPGYEMTKGSGGLWTYDIPDDLAGGEQGATGLIFHDNRGNQTDDLLLPADDKVKYVVADKEWVTHNETLLPSDVPTEPIYCVVPMTWERCSVYWWGSETECTWPGISMDHVQYDVYSAFIPADAGNVIFHSYGLSGESGYQTHNLTVSEGDRRLYMVDEELWTETSRVVSGSYYVTGSLLGSVWGPNDPNSLMTGLGNGFWLRQFENVEPGFYSVAVTDGTFDNQWSDTIPGTDDFGFELTVEELDTVTVLFDAVNEIVMAGVGEVGATPTEKPIVPTTYRVVGSTPWMGSWDPASNEGLMEEIDDWKYAKTFEDVKPGTYQFAITENGSWDHSWGMEGGNCTLKVTKTSDVTVYFRRLGVSTAISVEITPVSSGGTTPGTPPSQPGTTVYCQAPDSWEICNVYWWGSAEAVTWPGVAMTKGADGIWSFDVPDDATNILFNNMVGEEGAQSPDLIRPTDNKVKYVFANDEWVAHSESVTIIEKYYVAGSAALCGVEFQPADDNNLMAGGENGIWTKIYQDVPAGEYLLKVTDGTWNNTWCDDQAGTDGGFDSSHVLKLEETADVKVIFDSVNEIVTVEIGVFDETPDPPGETPDSGDPTEAVYYVTGVPALCGSNWDPDDPNNAMTKGADGVWTKIYENVQPGEYALKITDGTWENSWGDNGNNFCFTLSEVVERITVTFVLRDGVGVISVKGPSVPGTSGGDENDFYLVGNINGADYGIGEDCENLGEYKFVDGQLTVRFDQDSYVLVKSDDNTFLYAKTYCEETGVELSYEYGEKMKVPGGVEVTFTFARTGDATWWLSYVVNDSNAGDGENNGSNSNGGNTGNDDNMGSGGADDENITGIPSSFRVVGNADWMGNWDPANEQGRMFEVSPGVYKLHVEDVRPGTYELKITQNGTWDRSWGDNGNNYCFTVSHTCDIIITFVLRDDEGSISVKGTGMTNTDGGEDNIDIFRIQGSADWMGKSDLSKTIRMDQIATGVYQARLKGVTPGVYFFRVFRGSNPDHFWGDNGKDASFTVLAISDVLITFDLKTGKITTELIAVSQTDKENSEPVPDATVAPTEDVIDSTVGHPTTEPIPPTPDDGEVLRPEDTKPAQPNAGVEGGVCSAQPSPAIHLANMFWFCCVAVGIYGVFLLIRRRREMQVQTVEGHQFGAAPPLSIKDTEKLVADNPPEMPSAALDQRIFESIQKLNKES